jgi:hypothetical protein
MSKWILAACAAVVAVVIGCDKQPAAPQTSTASLPADLFVSTAPAGAIDVAAAKASADGQSVVIKGVIAGQKDPIASNRAIMTVADLSLVTCDKMPGDACPTPWDACCEPKDVIVAKTLSVQVVGSDGQPIKTGLSGAGGLAPNKQVVIAGTLTSAADAKILHARQIHLVP